MELVRKFTHRSSLKSKSINAGGIELILEVRIKDKDTDFINEISKENGVGKATLITSNEDLASF